MAIPKVQIFTAIFWPSFIVAGAGNSFIFTFFDPLDVLAYSDYAHIGRIAAYSIGFLVLWTVTATSSLATAYFLKPCPGPDQQQNSNPGVTRNQR